MLTSPFLVDAPVQGGSNANQNLAGSSSQANGTALTPGRYATAIFNVDMRLAFGASTLSATSADLYWPAKVPYSWYVENDTKFIAADADDGGAFKGSVWQSSRG